MTGSSAIPNRSISKIKQTKNDGGRKKKRQFSEEACARISVSIKLVFGGTDYRRLVRQNLAARGRGDWRTAHRRTATVPRQSRQYYLNNNFIYYYIVCFVQITRRIRISELRRVTYNLVNVYLLLYISPP